MLLTTIEVSDKAIWEGTQVRNIKSGQIRTIRVLEPGASVYAAVVAGVFNPLTDIDLTTVLLNKTRFELIN